MITTPAVEFTPSRKVITMSNHPNRSKGNVGPDATPSTDQVIAAREKAGLTQTQAGELIYSTRSGWTKYETGERRMHPQLFEAFLIKTGQASADVYAGIDAARRPGAKPYAKQPGELVEAPTRPTEAQERYGAAARTKR